jgi:large subunit ribosomal protein L18
MSKIKRQIRIRKKIHKVSDRPRLSVFRSNKYCYAQIIDNNGNALFGLSEKALTKQGTRIENAKALGAEIAKKALEKKIKEVVFDKGSFAYHGKVKAIAEGAREAGLQF